jgi:hypothetical protein
MASGKENDPTIPVVAVRLPYILICEAILIAGKANGYFREVHPTGPSEHPAGTYCEHERFWGRKQECFESPP